MLRNVPKIPLSLSSDLRTKSWFLSNTPGPLFTILGTYLYFCLYAGPRFMKDRKPFQLKNVLIAYNAVQVALSIVLVWEVSYRRTINLNCFKAKINYRDSKVVGEVSTTTDVNQWTIPTIQWRLGLEIIKPLNIESDNQSIN